ncbi:response regulator [Desulfonatronum sp. SC1]|uniref:hybrid sensor histidine kinase/response regulator n=1 Tax=Desulfonatronum sp. SC1 TaxID=2109626 RepID=UPI000D327C23|nr:response regulator [Desulfonatronum sp. SC1]PTN38427.1 hypothetical protein C6366_02395 [Desulfonatronum sp. SC1]
MPQPLLFPPSICPATSLPVRTPPEWSGIALSNQYRATFSVIGEAILHVALEGKVDPVGTAAALRERRRVLLESGLMDRPFVEIRNHGEIIGIPSKESRMLLTNALVEDIRAGRLVGFWVYNAPVLIRAMINVGARLHDITIPTGAVRDYQTAMRSALRVLPVAAFLPAGSTSELVRAAWTLELDGYGVRIELVEPDILYTVAQGALREEHVDPIFDLYAQILEESGLVELGYCYRVVNGERIAGFSWKARKRFIQRVLAMQEMVSCRAYLAFGVNTITRGVMALNRPYVPFPVLSVRDYDEAMQTIGSLRDDKRNKAGGTDTVYTAAQVQSFADELLEYIGNINWDQPALEWRELAWDHPFKHVFDAVTVVKGDVVDLLDERRQAEQVLKESEEKYRNILDNIEDGYFELDLAGRFTFYNDSLCWILGASRAELHGVNIRDRLRPESVSILDSALDTVQQTQAGFGYLELRMCVEDEDLVVETSISLLRNRDGALMGYSGLLRDVTERKQSEQARHEARLAEASSRTKSEFLANMSHEIRTPLNAIIGMTELSLEEALDDALREALHVISREANALLEIINEILDFSKIEAGKLDFERIDFDLRYVLDHVVESFVIQAEAKGLELIVFQAPDVPVRLVGDPGRLRQVLLNLVGNALKFTHAGEVVLSVEVASDHGEAIVLRFSVRDTGIGIPPDKQALVFESFTQVDDSTTRLYGGTGLGLSICKRFVELMGGEVGLESQVGQGSSFWFTLPLHRQVSPDPTPAPRVCLPGSRILVVDDNTANRGILLEYLRSWECEAVWADSAVAALRVLERCQAEDRPVDMLLSDVGMSGVNGFELAAEIRRLEREGDARKGNAEVLPLPIILLSSSGYRGDGALCMKIGIQGYLPKPVRREELGKAMETVLGFASFGATRHRLVTRHSLAEERDRPCGLDESGAVRSDARILLAEDYPTNRQVAQRHLQSAGYRVDIAENGRQALELCAKTAYDLILMDIQMPEMDGWEATRRIRAAECRGEESDVGRRTSDVADRISGPQVSSLSPQPTHRRTPIIAMTAHALKGYREQCLAQGMDDYLTKPVRRVELLAMVRKWLRPEKGEVGEGQVRAGDGNASDHLAGADGPTYRDDGPPMDFAVALEEFEGDRDLLEEVITGFLEQARHQLDLLDRAAVRGDTGTLTREAHAIKGGAANLTAKSLSEVAARLERGARADDLEEAAPLVARLRHELERLNGYVKERQ